MKNFILVKGAKFEPLFPTEQEYQEFREQFEAEVKPTLDAQRESRCRSIEDAMYFWCG